MTPATIKAIHSPIGAPAGDDKRLNNSLWHGCSTGGQRVILPAGDDHVEVKADNVCVVCV